MSDWADFEVRPVGVDDLRSRLGENFAVAAPQIVAWLRGWAQRLEDEHRYPSGNPDWETGYTVAELERGADILDHALRSDQS